MKLLALIIAFAISHFVNEPEKYRKFSWFNLWSNWLVKCLNTITSELLVVLIVAIPVSFISVILYGLIDSQLGLLLVGIVILSYCIGPKSFEEDVDSGDVRKRLGVRSNAKAVTLIKKMTQVSLTRWFGVFFWYVVLGIVGALIYRFSERLSNEMNNSTNLQLTVDKLMKILNYPVAWMMVVSLAIASDFERIVKKCKPYMNIENIKSMDTSFLYEAADFAVEICEVEPDNKEAIEIVTISVLKRMLVVWLVVVSFLVILAV